MNRPTSIIAVTALAALALAVSCGPESEPPAPAKTPPVDKLLARLPKSATAAPEPALEKARQAAQALGVGLKAELLKALGEKGPVGAIEVCSRRAPEIASSVSTDGLHVRRVSLKVRNPADRPDPWEKDLLERLVEIAAADRSAVPKELAVVVDAGGGQELRYVKPLFIAKPCLTCHGPAESIDPQVREKLATLYPGDKAVGYQLGDLRGVISVRLPLERP